MRPSRARLRAVPPRVRARAYFAVQALVGGLWWVAVFASPQVRSWTLGEWRPGVLVGPDLALFVGASALAAALGSRRWAVVAAGWTTAVTVALGGYALVTGRAGLGALGMVVASGGTLAATAVLWSGRLPVQWFFAGPFAFRVAGERSGRRHLSRSLGQLVVFWTVLLVLVPVLLAAAERRIGLAWSGLSYPGQRWAGGAVFVLASGFGLWACFTMALRGEGTPLPAATARRLVVAGPYRVVRNPMALAGGLQTVGAGLWLGSWLVLAAAVAGALAWDSVIRPVEEADLAARFGADYQDYSAAVRCWVPTLAAVPLRARPEAAVTPTP